MRTFLLLVGTSLSVVAGADEPPGPTISLDPSTYTVGGYSTIGWKGVAPCTASAVPEYSAWSGAKGADWAQSVAPKVSTTFTITCANGAASTSLVVSGSGPPPPAAGGDGPALPAISLPVPPVLGTPIALSARSLSRPDKSTAWILKFAQTARRSWTFEGHAVTEPFADGQGYWNYEDCVQFYSVWLFDRPSSWFRLYDLTGEQAYLDQAITDFRYYASKIDSRGVFSCKTGEDDTKYLYVTPFLLYERATHDMSYRPIADRVYAQSAQGFSLTYDPSEALWTERELGIHMEAAVSYYELTGNEQALARAAAYVRQWDTMAATTGAPQVSYTQHEGGGPGGTQPTNPTNSPWMSAFYFQAARRYWQLTGDEMILHHASRYFDWLDANALYDGSLFHPEFTGVTVPRYLTGELIGDAGYDEGNMQHCPDVEGLVAFALLAKQRLGEPTARVEQRLKELKECNVRMAAAWTRDTNELPKYRIQAPRAWNWWMRGIWEASQQ